MVIDTIAFFAVSVKMHLLSYLIRSFFLSSVVKMLFQLLSSRGFAWSKCFFALPLLWSVLNFCMTLIYPWPLVAFIQASPPHTNTTAVPATLWSVFVRGCWKPQFGLPGEAALSSLGWLVYGSLYLPGITQILNTHRFMFPRSVTLYQHTVLVCVWRYTKEIKERQKLVLKSQIAPITVRGDSAISTYTHGS